MKTYKSNEQREQMKTTELMRNQIAELAPKDARVADLLNKALAMVECAEFECRFVQDRPEVGGDPDAEYGEDWPMIQSERERLALAVCGLPYPVADDEIPY